MWRLFRGDWAWLILIVFELVLALALLYHQAHTGTGHK